MEINSSLSNMTLLQKFSEGQELFHEVENTNLTAKDPQYNELITNSIRCFQTCAVMISQNSLFSPNEELTDYSTSSLKYLSVPYYLGELYQKVPTTDPTDRLPVITRAKENLEKYVNNCIRLGIMSKRDTEAYRNDAADAETKRNEKIRRYRREKEIQQQIQNLMAEKLKNGINGTDEDEEETEFERKTSLLFLENNMIKAIDTISSLKQEIEIVQHMAKLMEQNGGKLPPRTAPEPRQPIQPIVINDTRQFLKDNAFRPGWNLPTVSLEQAAEIDYQDMLRREARQKEAEKKKSQKLVKEWEDDEEELKKDRDFDNYKDDHPRGSGNTGTKGYHY